MSKYFVDSLGVVGLDNYWLLPKHKQEQIVYRYSILVNHPVGSLCLKNNMCPCECTTSEVLLSDPACDKKCFPDMLGELEWNTFKEQNRMAVDLHRNKIIKYN